MLNTGCISLLQTTQNIVQILFNAKSLRPFSKLGGNLMIMATFRFTSILRILIIILIFIAGIIPKHGSFILNNFQNIFMITPSTLYTREQCRYLSAIVPAMLPVSF